jgi:hypothetical protein
MHYSAFAALAEQFVPGSGSGEKCREFKPISTVHGVVFDILCSDMQKPSPGDGRGLRDVIRDRNPQVFFSIGQTLFSSGMNASAAGIVATRL